MGSGSKKKSRDSIIIARPQKYRTGSGGGGGHTNNDSDPNKVCLPSFDVKIRQDKILKKGLILTLDGEKVLLGGINLGILSARQKIMVERCKEFVYRGSVEFDKKTLKFYGRFFRAQ